MNLFDTLRGLHIIAVIAWMSGMMYLPRLYAYHTETAPPGSEFDANFLVWERKLLKIIINPSMILTWILGVSLIFWHVHAAKEGWAFLAQPWMIVKLAAVIFLSGWHGFLAGSYKKFLAGERSKSAKFWRATNELPFLAAVVAVLAVTLQFGQR
ncbi:CopD family protein [Phenylobacterium sp. LH3H17]|uniref:CopD family protein n=1 Tax=Phenylobacterium sp. LH3H17 TaxID=2903901 RepID=UPI0020CA1234|nr:CopD family protein [Phenylobacterium sp. LH3H17]UTP39662.1 CopD family protein [Phenylobacterium sp. LH3H17]